MIAVKFGDNSFKYGSRVLGAFNEFDFCKQIAEAFKEGSDSITVYKPGTDGTNKVLLKLKIEEALV